MRVLSVLRPVTIKYVESFLDGNIVHIIPLTPIELSAKHIESSSKKLILEGCMLQQGRMERCGV